MATTMSILSIFQLYFELKSLLNCPTQEAAWQMFVFVLSYNNKAEYFTLVLIL